MSDRNAEILRTLIARSGLARLPAARLTLAPLEPPPDEAAVDLPVSLSGQRLRLRFTNRDDAVPAFARTPSFNIVFIREPGFIELDSRRTADLSAMIERLARFDPGGLALVVAPRTRGASLPMVGGLVERAWQRDLFDRSLDRLLQRGTRAERLVIVVAQACEMNCTFCPTMDRVNINFRPSGEDGQLDDLAYQLRRGRELGATEIDFGGNDVLRFPGIISLFEAAGAAGYAKISAQSPGQILADRAFAEAASRSPLTHVCLPIYGTTAEVHDAVTRRPGAFDGLVRALDNLADLGRPIVELHTIALQSTLAQLPELIAFCRDRFGAELRIATLRSNRQGERDVVLDVASFAALRPLIARFPDNFRAEFPPCLFPRELVPPRFRDAPAGESQAPINLYDLGLPAGSEDADVARARAHVRPPPCERCAARFECGGVLAHYVEMFGDAELVPFGAD